MVLRTFPRAGEAPARFLRLLAGIGLVLVVGAPASADPERPELPSSAQIINGEHAQRIAGTTPLAELRARLDNSDRLAALHALQMALNQVGDGSTFLWKKEDRNLMGIIKPTAAFRNAAGQVCRHVIYAISLGDYRKQIEIVACREAGGRWRL